MRAMFEELIKDHIAVANRHLQEAEERIARQRKLIDAFEGRDKTRAEAVLGTYLSIVEQMQIHRRLLDGLAAGNPVNGMKKGPAS